MALFRTRAARRLFLAWSCLSTSDKDGLLLFVDVDLLALIREFARIILNSLSLNFPSLAVILLQYISQDRTAVTSRKWKKSLWYHFFDLMWILYKLRRLKQIYTAHKLIVSADNWWTWYIHTFFCFTIKSSNMSNWIHWFISGKKRNTLIVTPFDCSQFYINIVWSPQFNSSSTLLFHGCIWCHLTIR